MRDEHKQAVAHYFSQNARYWREIYSDTEDLTNKFFQVNRRKQVIIQLIDSLPKVKTLRILDIGCGSGGIMGDLANQGYSVVAGDISWQMVREAQRCCGHWIGTSDYLQCDVEQMPFASRSFDVIICAGVMSYLSDINQGLHELYRVLKDPGILVMTVPNLLRLNVIFDPCYYVLKIGRLSGEKLYQYLKPDRYVDKSSQLVIPEAHKYLYGQLSRVFAVNGFRIEKTISLGFGPLTFGRRQLLSERNAERMNQVLERLAQKRYCSFLNVCANHWIIILQRL